MPESVIVSFNYEPTTHNYERILWYPGMQVVARNKQAYRDLVRRLGLLNSRSLSPLADLSAITPEPSGRTEDAGVIRGTYVRHSKGSKLGTPLRLHQRGTPKTTATSHIR
jgi:hypothetical protein